MSTCGVPVPRVAGVDPPPPPNPPARGGGRRCRRMHLQGVRGEGVEREDGRVSKRAGAGGRGAGVVEGWCLGTHGRSTRGAPRGP